MTATHPPVVHDLQFGTYSSPHTDRGRHSRWPCMCGVTRSHGRRAGAWLRLGDRSFWCCLQRPCRRLRGVTRVDPVRPPLPAGTPPTRAGEAGFDLARALHATAVSAVLVLAVVIVVLALAFGVFR